MREGIRYRRADRRSRRLVSLLAYAVLMLAAWVLATNTLFSPSNEAAPDRAGLDDAIAGAESSSEIAVTRQPKAEAVPPVAPAAETAAAEDKPGPELTEPVVIAAVAPVMGGTETLLSPTLVSRAVEPAIAPSPDDLVPLPPARPRLAAVPLPLPRPVIAEPRVSGRTITEWEIQRQQLY